MRTLTVTAQAEIAVKNGLDPIIIVEIDWSDVLTGTYCNAASYESIDDRIMNIGNLELGTKVSGSGGGGSIQLSLDDTDGAIKDIMDANDVYLRPARVYQSFRTLTSGTDRFLLFDGVINSPVVWNETTRIIDLTIQTPVEDGEFGFAPEEGSFTCLAPDAVGVAWPLAYGSPVRFKAAKVTDTPNGIIQSDYRLITYTDLRNLHPLIDERDEYAVIKTTYEAEHPTPTTGEEKLNYDAMIQEYNKRVLALHRAVNDLVNDEPAKETNIGFYITYYQDLRDEKRLLTAAIDEKVRLEQELAESNKTEADLVAAKSEANAEPIPNSAVVSALTTNIADENTRQATLTSDIATLTGTTIPGYQSSVATKTDTLRLKTKDLIEVDFTSLNIEAIHCFDKSPTVVNTVINNTVISGIFSDTTFVRSSGFNRLYNNISFDTRANSNPNELWIDSDLRIKGMYILINRAGTPSYCVAYITEQIGRRCFFEPPLYDIDGNGIKTPYLPAAINGHIDEVCGTVLPDWLDNVFTEDADATGFEKLPDNDWEIKPGDYIRANVSFGTKYIANAIPSSAVHEILAYRTRDGVRMLANIPEAYYVIDLAESLVGETVTSITLAQPLEFFNDELWETDIYVTLTSSIGPNTADIIEDLLTRYANTITPNSVSFTAMQSLMTKYPMHFVIRENGNVLALIDRLCWQARIGAFLEGGELFLKYLSYEEASVFTLDQDNVRLGSQVINLTETEKLITRLRGDWHIAEAHVLGYQDLLEFHVTVRNNIPKYGEFREDYNFFAYNIESLVLKSLVFWAIRYSMIWQYITVTCFLDTLELQLFDTVDISLPEYTGKGVIQRITYNIVANEVSYRIWLPLRAGETTEYAVAWPSSTPTTTAWPTVSDPHVIIGDTNGN